MGYFYVTSIWHFGLSTTTLQTWSMDKASAFSRLEEA